MGLRLLFIPNFPGATFIQEAMFIPDSRVCIIFNKGSHAVLKIDFFI